MSLTRRSFFKSAFLGIALSGLRLGLSPLPEAPKAQSVLSAFSDFVNETRPAYFATPDIIINEAVKNTYVLERLLK